MKKIKTILISILIANTAAFGQVWTGGAGDNNFLTPGNWAGGSIPPNFGLASWNGTDPGNLSLTFSENVGNTGGIRLFMSGSQTGNLSIANSNAASRNFRLGHDGSNITFDMASGAGNFALGTTGNAMTLAMGGNIVDKVYTFRNNSASVATFGSNASVSPGGGVGGTIKFTGTGSFVFDARFTATSDAGRENVELEGGAQVTLTADNVGIKSVTVTEGTLIANNLVNSSVGSGPLLVDTNGILRGQGIIGGDTTINGTLNPGIGVDTGRMEFFDNVAMGATSELSMQINSTGVGGFDQLVGTHGSALNFADGATIVFSATGYTPNGGDTFQLFDDWASISGSNITFTGTDLGGGFSFDTSNLLTDGYITVIPEPATVAIIIPLLAMLIALKKRK